MLPAFHGEQVARLAEVMAEVAAAEVERWPRDEPVALHPRLQALTLEVILRTVFGLEAGARLERLRQHMTEVLAVGASPVSLLPPLQHDLGRATPWGRFVRTRAAVDAELLRAHRGAPPRRGPARRRPLAAPRRAPRRRLADERPGAARRAHDAARRRPRDDRLPARVHLRAPRAHAGRARAADARRSRAATATRTSRRRCRRACGAGRCCPTRLRGWSWRRSRSAAGAIRAGVCLVPNAYLIQHDPAIYPDPYAFRPERFLDKPPGTYTWIPFGGGRRRCLGAAFATVEMKVVLRAVLERAQPRLAGDGRLELSRRRSITLSPREGAEVVLA